MEFIHMMGTDVLQEERFIWGNPDLLFWSVNTPSLCPEGDLSHVGVHHTDDNLRARSRKHLIHGDAETYMSSC